MRAEPPSRRSDLTEASRAGVSLLEMLVAIVVSSVVMMSVGILYQTSMVNYNVVRDVRENLYTSTLTSDRITDALRRPNAVEVKVRDDIPTSGNDCITYNYLKSAFQSKATSWSGIVFYHSEKLWLYENKIGSDLAPPYGDGFTAVVGSKNFNQMTDADVKTWVNDASNRQKSEIIGYGVSTFQASKNIWGTVGSVELSRATTWSVTYLKAGRG